MPTGLTLRGIAHGSQIDLDEDLGLPVGSAVDVTIHPQALSLEARRQLVDALCGSWAADPTIADAFAVIERERQGEEPRDAAFDVSP